MVGAGRQRGYDDVVWRDRIRQTVAEGSQVEAPPALTPRGGQRDAVAGIRYRGGDTSHLSTLCLAISRRIGNRAGIRSGDEPPVHEHRGVPAGQPKWGNDVDTRPAAQQASSEHDLAREVVLTTAGHPPIADDPAQCGPVQVDGREISLRQRLFVTASSIDETR